MYILFYSIIIGLFIAMLFVNVYFRVKVFKAYKVLVQNRVEFNAMDIFSKKKLEEEVYPNNPGFQKEIETFANHMRYSIKMATVLIALITALGALMMWFREM